MSEIVIDLNADLGESPERLADGNDAAMMREITSANVACGAHAGDAATMHATVELARELGVAVGAHPSYPDRANFGRIAIDIPIADLEASIHAQITELAAIARTVGVEVAFVKPHGALYHSCNSNAEVAKAVARAVLAIDKRMAIVAQAGAACHATYRDMGLMTIAEAFADRAYEADGTLRDRRKPGALLDSPERAAEQALNIVVNRSVRSFDGGTLALTAESLCMHSDTPDSAAIAAAVRRKLESSGVVVQSIRRR